MVQTVRELYGEKQRFLASYAEADRAVARQIESLRRVRAYEKTVREVSAGRTGAKDRLRETEAALEDAVRRWDRTRGDVEDAVGALEDPRLRELLERHYFQGETFREVAAAMHYSERHIARMHRQALEALRMPRGV